MLIGLLTREGGAELERSVGRIRKKAVPAVGVPTNWNEEQSRQNFELIKRVAFLGNQESPLLVHPLLETAGGDFFHSGGNQFADRPGMAHLESVRDGRGGKAGAIVAL